MKIHSYCLNIKQLKNIVNGLCGDHFNDAEWKAYLKSTHFQNVTNYSFITRHFMMQGTIMLSIVYQPVRQYLYLKTTHFNVSNPEISNNSHTYHSLKTSFYSTILSHTYTHTHTHIEQ
jgi:hypothetical protein